MRSRARWLWVLLILTVLAGLHSGNSFAQVGESRYFEETGHWVSGDFLVKYNSVPNPELVFGLPITGQFISADGREVQYFERARFELNPVPQTPDLRVLISPLGEYLYETAPSGTGQTAPVNEATCQRITPDGPAVCHSFLRFFNENGGILVFGYPISETEWLDGMYVQYFDRACFEWHPELPPGQSVVLSNVGERYFYQVENPSWRSIDDGDYTASVIELQVHAFVSQAVVAPSNAQMLYVVVQDQNLQPVQGVGGSATLTLADGTQVPYIMNPTDANGISFVEIVLGDQPFGLTQIDVTMDDGAGLKAYTRTFYQVWW